MPKPDNDFPWMIEKHSVGELFSTVFGGPSVIRGLIVTAIIFGLLLIGWWQVALGVLVLSFLFYLPD